MELELAGIALQVKTPHIEKLRPLLREYIREPKSAEAALTEEPLIDVQLIEEPLIDVPLIEVSEQDVLTQKELTHKVFAEIAEDPPADELEYEFVALYKKILNYLIEHKVIYLHGSLISINGNGYLFMAPSGTGKSTHVRLWKERYGDQVTVINDDKPVVKVNGDVRAYGTPWNGKHRLGCNSVVPLKGIVRLRRGLTNKSDELDKREALKLLYIHTLHFDDACKMKLMLEVIGTIVEKVRFYDLQCNMELEAAEVAYEKLINSHD